MGESPQANLLAALGTHVFGADWSAFVAEGVAKKRADGDETDVLVQKELTFTEAEFQLLDADDRDEWQTMDQAELALEKESYARAQRQSEDLKARVLEEIKRSAATALTATAGAAGSSDGGAAPAHANHKIPIKAGGYTQAWSKRYLPP